MKIILLLCAFILIGCVSPQSNRPFAKRKQAMNAFQKRFRALDVDGNGELSRTEFSKSQAAQRSTDSDNLFKSADTSGDEVLTLKELQQALRKLKLNRNWYSPTISRGHVNIREHTETQAAPAENGRGLPSKCRSNFFFH